MPGPDAAVALHFLDGFAERFAEAVAASERLLAALALHRRVTIERGAAATNVTMLRVGGAGAASCPRRCSPAASRSARRGASGTTAPNSRCTRTKRSCAGRWPKSSTLSPPRSTRPGDRAGSRFRATRLPFSPSWPRACPACVGCPARRVIARSNATKQSRACSPDPLQKGPAMPQGKIRHFGVLIPSTNTTVETEFTRLLPPEWQPHYARVKSASIDGSPFSPPLDADVEYQSKMLGTAKVEIVMLIQTSASLFSEDYDDKAMRLMQGAGAPGFTSAMAIGEALQRARHQADRAGLALFGDRDRQRPALLRGPLRAVGRRARRLCRDQFVYDRQSRAGDGARRLRPHRPAPRSRRLSCPAAISRRWRRSRPGRRNSASRSSRPIRPRYGACYSGSAARTACRGSGGCWRDRAHAARRPAV